MTDEEIAVVTMPDGSQHEVIVQRDLRCLTHGGQPGWGCESCRESIVNAVVGFKPVGGWQSIHRRSHKLS